MTGVICASLPIVLNCMFSPSFLASGFESAALAYCLLICVQCMQAIWTF